MLTARVSTIVLGCHPVGQTEHLSNYGKCYFWSPCPTNSNSVTDCRELMRMSLYLSGVDK